MQKHLANNVQLASTRWFYEYPNGANEVSSQNPEIMLFLIVLQQKKNSYLERFSLGCAYQPMNCQGMFQNVYCTSSLQHVDSACLDMKQSQDGKGNIF